MNEEDEKKLLARIEALELDVKLLKQATGTAECPHSFHRTPMQFIGGYVSSANRICPRCQETWRRWTNPDGSTCLST